jgi:P27 family predicted phage terminase small subunit
MPTPKRTPVILSIGGGDSDVKPIKNPPAPKHLDKIAATKWRSVVPTLTKMRTLTLSDLTLLEMFCVCYSNWRKAITVCNTDGLVLKADEGGYYVSPWSGVQNRMVELSTKLCSELGLSPTARAKIMGAERPSKRGKITRRNRLA